VLRTQAYRISGATWDETDFEGNLLPSAMAEVACIFINLALGSIVMTTGTDHITVLPLGKMILFQPVDGILASGGSISFEPFATGDETDASFTIDIHALA
jgi:hypothetical protein